MPSDKSEPITIYRKSLRWRESAEARSGHVCKHLCKLSLQQKWSNFLVYSKVYFGNLNGSYMSYAKKKNCYLCESSVSVGEGTVPLCKPTKNKEFCGKSFCKAGSIILSDLIKSVGINCDKLTVDDSQSSVCKKCARKIVNCCTLFHELQEVFRSKVKTAPGLRDLEAGDGGSIKRLHSDNSPSGLTPGSKKQRDTTSRERASGCRAKKSLFDLNSAWTERERVEDSVANLMCLPVAKPTIKDDHSTSVVKVGL